MLYAFAMVLITLWLFGLMTTYTMGGFVHLLLIAALLLALGNFFWRAKRA
jgi:Family of unknown function (DUF5670)